MNVIHCMTKLINIIGSFKNKAALLSHQPSSIEVRYDSDGFPLNPKDYAKWEKITEYYLKYDLYPTFLPTEAITDNDAAITAEAYEDLSKWSRDGLPMFKIKLMTGQPINLPTKKGQQRRKPDARKTQKRVHV